MGYTKQEALNKAIETIYMQGGPAIAKDGTCEYIVADATSSNKGRKCGIGALLPDELCTRLHSGGFSAIGSIVENGSGKYTAAKGIEKEVYDILGDETAGTWAPIGSNDGRGWVGAFATALQRLHDGSASDYLRPCSDVEFFLRLESRIPAFCEQIMHVSLRTFLHPGRSALPRTSSLVRYGRGEGRKGHQGQVVLAEWSAAWVLSLVCFAFFCVGGAFLTTCGIG